MDNGYDRKTEKMMEENLPIYLQLMNTLRRNIVSGKLLPGGKIPSVRELAALYEVNPNTMQRALSELEREGLLCSERTSGRFVTGDYQLILKVRQEEAKKTVEKFMAEMVALGFESHEILQFFRGEYIERVG